MMKKFIYLALLCLASFASFCQDYGDIPEYSSPKISITSVSDITSNFANVNYQITDNGGACFDLVVVNVDVVNTFDSPNLIIIQTGFNFAAYGGIITQQVVNLAPCTQYYFRVTVIRDLGILSSGTYPPYADSEYARSQIVSASTECSATIPVVSTVEPTYVSSTSCNSGGNVTSDGGSSVTSRGVCWSTVSNPTISDSKTTNGSGTGSFSSSITGLTAGVTYYIRAYATNAIGTAYGNEYQYTGATLPNVSLFSIFNITSTSANVGCIINSTGYTTLTDKGIVWNTTGSPTLANSSSSNGSGGAVGTGYTGILSGLTANTTYYVRPYATNIVGTYYGNQTDITTNPSGVIVPTVTTTAPSSITETTAISGGNVTSDGGGTILTRGIEYSVNSDFSSAVLSVPSSPTTGLFTSNISGLTCGTTYYVRAYASNSAGTGYGSVISFIPHNLDAYLSLTLGSYITSPNCGSYVFTSSKSLACQALSDYNNTSCGTINKTITTDTYYTISYPITSGLYVYTLSGCIANLNGFYIDRTAQHSTYDYIIEINNGLIISVTQCTTTTPTVTTSAISEIGETTATSGGYVTSDGGSTVTARGVCWSTSQNPTTLDSHTTNGSGVGAFSSYMTGLNCGTTYFTRAYATNESGTAYGNIVTFSTELCIYTPTVSLNTINKYGDTYATFSGSVTDDGNSAVTERGFVYSTTPNPTTSSNKIISGSGVGVFSANAYGLFSSTKYYVRAYAINNVGTSYSNELDFTTLESPTNVSISTSVPVNIATNSATLGGNISSDGGNTVTERGVVYGLSINPTTSNTKIQSGDGIGIYSVNVTGLTQGTTYHVRAYAINSNGTFYGADESFITSIDGATACNAGQTFPGGQSYPSTNTIVLGSGTGDVTLTFSANNIPDFFLVEYNSTLYNSGWRGSPIYDYGGTSRASFKLALFGKTDPSQNPAFPTTFPNIMLYPEDGYPRVISGSGSISFTKSTSNPTTATVKVYAPMSDTYWTYILSCPN